MKSLMLKKWNNFIEKIGTDKILHFSISLNLVFIGAVFDFPGILISSILTLILGIGKEFLDDIFSWGDIIADCLGISLGIFVWYISTLF